jgi:16S rRNA (guanine527-N7)-methyltransferase
MFRELLTREFSAYGNLTDLQVDQLEAHYRLLVAWNRKMNLTRMRSVEDAVCFHYCESLFLGLLLPGGELRVADVGSGAGFPGIPVAVLRPEFRVTLIESNGRKAVFLREASRPLSNISVLEGRAEDVAERFDWLTSRAIAPNVVRRLPLAPNVALLTSESETGNLGEGWRVCRSPWGSHRFCATFHVKP